MIEFKENCIYSRQDLTEMFDPYGVKWDTLRAKLEHHPGLRKFTVAGWLGSDLLAAMRGARSFDQTRDEKLMEMAKPQRTGRRGRPQKGFADLLKRGQA